MDCWNLYKQTKSTGNFWKNAAAFAISNATLGMKLLKTFDYQLRNTNESAEHANITLINEVKKNYFKTVINFPFSSEF